MISNFPAAPWPFILLTITATTVFSSWIISKEALSIKEVYDTQRKTIEEGNASEVRKSAFIKSYSTFRSSHNRVICLLICNNITSIGLAFLVLLYIFCCLFKELFNGYAIGNYINLLGYPIFFFLLLTYTSIATTILFGKRFFRIGLVPDIKNFAPAFIDPLDEELGGGPPDIIN